MRAVWIGVCIAGLVIWVVAAQDAIFNGGDLIGVALAIVAITRINAIQKSKEEQDDEW